MDNKKQHLGKGLKHHPVAQILVFVNEPELLAHYRDLLGQASYECITSDSAQHTATLLTRHHPDLVIADMSLSATGLDILERVYQHDRQIPVILIGPRGSVHEAVLAMKHHAADYLARPFVAAELLGKIEEALRLYANSRSGRGAKLVEKPEGPWQEKIVGRSYRILEVLDLARKVAHTDVNVLISGESGTGKELFARLIHHFSPRRHEIFVPVDCASLPESLLESEMFGYNKGAFTGAHSDKMGLFQFAHRGTLFLDEVGELPLALQSKFLRVLQEHRFRPIGGCREIEADVRVVAATNIDPEQALRDKTFRSDLYYRLSVVTLRIPPLRERREDIGPLAEHFLKEFTGRADLGGKSFSPHAFDCLKNFAWPGNVRQLQNVVQHAMALVQGEQIGVEDLPEELRATGTRTPAATGEHLFQRKGRLIDHFERDYLINLLVENHFNISKAAEVAGCHRRTLYRMAHRYQLDLDALRHQHQRDGEPFDDDSADAQIFTVGI